MKYKWAGIRMFCSICWGLPWKYDSHLIYMAEPQICSEPSTIDTRCRTSVHQPITALLRTYMKYKWAGIRMFCTICWGLPWKYDYHLIYMAEPQICSEPSTIDTHYRTSVYQPITALLRTYMKYKWANKRFFYWFHIELLKTDFKITYYDYPVRLYQKSFQ